MTASAGVKPADCAGDASPGAGSVLRRDLRLITGDGVIYSFMVGVGEAYLPAFTLALGMGEVVAGLIATVPIIFGALLQLVTPWGVRRLGSHRRWVLLCATTQALSFIPLVIAALVGRLPVPAVFAIAAVYWAAAMGAGPAWNTWMGLIVPLRIRATFFGRRSRLCQLATLVGLLTGGLLLARGEAEGRLLFAFATLFSLGCLARLGSTGFLARQSEPPGRVQTHRHVPLRELIGRVHHGPDVRLLTYMLAVQVSVQVSGAYFNPYMLGELGFSKGAYMLLLSTSFVAKSAFLPLWGATARRFGARRLLRVSGFAIIPLAGFWMITDDVWGLILVQVSAGAAWGAYELATFLLMLETIREEERTSVLTFFNVANAMAIVTGSFAGAAILIGFEQSATGYIVIFGFSTVLRVFTLGLLARVTTDRRSPEPIAVGPIAVRPNMGSIDRPILPSITVDAENGAEALSEPELETDGAGGDRSSEDRAGRGAVPITADDRGNGNPPGEEEEPVNQRSTVS